MSTWADYKKEKGIKTEDRASSSSRSGGEDSAWQRYKNASGKTTYKQTAQEHAAQKKEQNVLRQQRAALEKNGTDAGWADYYARQTEYNAKYGTDSRANLSYLSYKQAMDRASRTFSRDNSRYGAEQTLNRAGDMAGDMVSGAVRAVGNALTGRSALRDAKNELETQDRRAARDADLYGRMAETAVQTGNQELYNRAEQGYNDRLSGYNSAVERYNAASDNARKEWLNELHETNRGAYFGETLDQHQIEGQLAGLRKQRDELAAQVQEAEDAWHQADQTNYTDRELLYRGREKKLQQIEDEITTYEAALKYRNRSDYVKLRNEMAPMGYITDPALKQKAEEGRAKWNADRQKAEQEGWAEVYKSLSFNEEEPGESITMRTGMKNVGWDFTVEDAKHLKISDQQVFFALYADDPEKALKFVREAKDYTDEAYSSQLAEAAGENAATRFAAFVGGTAYNWASGAGNLLETAITGDPYSEDIMEMSRTGRALISGGAQGLQEKGIFNLGEKNFLGLGWGKGTISEDTPIVGYILGGKGLGDLYQLGSSILESTTTAAIAASAGDYADAISALGVIIMGSSASVADYDECIKRGLTEKQALHHALAAGINEAAFEWISLDKLVNPDYGASALKRWFTQAGVEASEEFCTSVANRIADGYLARKEGYDTQIEQRMKELIALGVDHDEAMHQAQNEWQTELINDALGGFISGGFSEGLNLVAGNALSKGGQAFTNAMNRLQYESKATADLQAYGADLTDAGQLAALRSFSEANGINFDADAVRGLETRIQQQEKTGLEGATISQTMENAAEEKQSRKEAKQEAQTNRSLGVVREQVIQKIGETVRQRGLNSVQAVSDELAEQHGAGIKDAVQAAVAREAKAEFGKLSTAAEMEQIYRSSVEGVKDVGLRQTIESAYRRGLSEIVLDQGRNTDARRSAGAKYRTMSRFDTGVKLKGEDGKTASFQIADVVNNAKDVVLSDGRTVSVKELKEQGAISLAAADLLDSMAFMKVGDAASVMWKSFLKGANNRTSNENYQYVMDWAQLYEQGRVGDMSLEDAVANAKNMDPREAMDAYEQGVKAREAADKAEQAQFLKNRERNAALNKDRQGKFDMGDVSEEAVKAATARDATVKEQIEQGRIISEALGVPVRMFDSNTDFTRENGRYEDGVIWLDINAGRNSAGDMKHGLLAVLGHELTHWMQEYGGQSYIRYRQAVVSAITKEKGRNYLEALINDQRSRNPELTHSQAIDEIVADASMDRMGDAEFWQAVADNLGDDRAEVKSKILQFVKDFFNKLLEALGASQRFWARDVVASMQKDVQKTLAALYAEGIREAARNQKGQLANDGQAHDITNGSGTLVGVQDGSGNIQLSPRYYREGGRDAVKKYLNQRVRDDLMDRESANQIFSAIEEQYKALEEIVKDHPGSYKTFEEWAEAPLDVDDNGDPIFTWLKENTEYGLSGEASLICVKRRTLDAVFDEMIRSGMIENFDMVQQSIVAINDIIRSFGFETACSTCYIDAKRYRAAIVADTFCKMYNDLVWSMVPKAKRATLAPQFFNFGKNEQIHGRENALDSVDSKELDFTKLDAVIAKQEKKWKDSGKKTAGSVDYRIAVALKNDPSMRKLVLRGDFMSKTGFTEMGRKISPVLTLYNAKKGTGGPKATEADVQYLHDLLAKQMKPEDYFRVGGFRVQSFSDYVPRLVFDYVELIGDLAAKGIPSHAYTKELLFALQFGMTGMKINMSLIPAMVKGGKAPGLDANGNYAWRDGQSFGSTAYGLTDKMTAYLSKILGEEVKNKRLTAAQGYALAVKLQNAAGYGKNCGTIAIGVSWEQIQAMLDDDNIRMVIPYHKSGLNHILASMMNIEGFENYEATQNTLRWNKEKKVWEKLKDGDFKYNEAVQKHNGDAKAAAQDYLNWCRENGYKPKFAGYRAGSKSFQDAGYTKDYDFTIDRNGNAQDNYYKVLADFACYDSTGAIVKQEAVQAIFPQTGDAFGSMKDLMEMGLESDQALQDKTDKDLPEIIDRIKATLPELEKSLKGKKQEGAILKSYSEWQDKNSIPRKSTRATDDAYMKAVEDGDMETAQRLVDEAAKRAGYVRALYHGTPEKFTSFRMGDQGIHLGTKEQAQEFTKDWSTRYKWSDLRDNIFKMNEISRRDLVFAAQKLDDYTWRENGLGIKPYSGSLSDVNKITAYVDKAVSAFQSEMADETIDPSFTIHTWDREVNPDVMKLYAKISNPYVFNRDLEIWDPVVICTELIERSDGSEAGQNDSEIQLTDSQKEKLNAVVYWKTQGDERWNVIADVLAQHGYDGIQYLNTFEGKEGDYSYLALRPSDVKSADPVTYDDKGKVIPLSERFNPEKEDIRYSRKGTPLEGQMGLFGSEDALDGWMQTGLEEQVEEQKEPTSEELFLEEMDKFKKKLESNGKIWYGKEFDKFYADHPEMNFIARFHRNDPTVKSDMQRFVADIDDLQLLHDLSWYTTQSPLLKKGNFRGDVTKVRNAYKARMNQIMTEKNNGHKIKIEHRRYTFDEVRKLFDSLNGDEAVSKLAEKVFSVAKELNLDFYGTNKWYGQSNPRAVGANYGKDVFLRINGFADTGLSDQYKASTIVHELIHACTSYAIEEYEKGGFSRTLNPRIREAVGLLWDVYGQARGTIPTSVYGMTNVKEFVAELAQPEFREELQKHSLWERVLDAIKRFFGIENVKGNTYLDSASAALDYLLDNIDKPYLYQFQREKDEGVRTWERLERKSRYSTRDSSQRSDEELMKDTAEYLTEAGGEEYWQALLESAPELAGDEGDIQALMRDYKAQAAKLAETKRKLEEARREMKPTDRKLRTQGISGVVKDVMAHFTVTDAKNNKIVQRATQAIIDGYQAALDAIDAGRSGDVLDINYNAAVKAAEILLTEGRHTENIAGKWSNVSAERYLGEDRQQLIDYMVSAVGADFAMNRYRNAIKETAADRIESRTRREMQKKVDAQKEKNAALTEENEKLARDNEWLNEQATAAKEQVGSLNVQLQYVKEKMADAGKLSGKEKAKLRQRARNLNNRLQAAKAEAKAWKERAALEGNLATQYGEKQAALLKKLTAQVQREQDILSGKLKPLAMQRMLKAVREAENKRVTEQKEQVFENYKTRQKETALRNRIRNLSADIRRKMTAPTDNSFVPANLYGSMAKLADVLDNILAPKAGTKAAARYRAVMDAIHELSREYNDLKNVDDYVYKSEFDQEILDEIQELERVLNTDRDWLDDITGNRKRLSDFTLGELQQIYNILDTINGALYSAGKALGRAEYASIFDAIRSVVEQQKAITPIADVGKLEASKRRRLLGNLSPMRAVEMMSNWDRDAALYDYFQAVEQGTVDVDTWIMDYNKALQALKTGKNEKAYREAMTKLLDFGAKDKVSGKAVQMTKMQALQLLMTWQREQANPKQVHLQKGGAVIRDAIAIQDGKLSKATQHTVNVTPEMIARINDSLTDWDRAYMKALRTYLTQEGKETNKVLYKLKHRVLATEDNYIPYVVDKSYLEAKLDSADVYNIFVKSFGSTQALQTKAPQPVIIDGLDTMMTRHVRDAANYIGLAIPIRDFAKVFNGRLASEDGGVYTSLQHQLQENFDQKGTELITQALIDVQGGSRHQSWSSQIAENLNRLQGAFVRSALLVNPSVTIKQAASYIAAESVLSHRALVEGNRAFAAKGDKSRSPSLIAHIFASPEGATAQRIYNEIDEHTSMHYFRRQGMSRAELAEAAQKGGKFKRFAGNVGAQMEQSTIGHIARKGAENLDPTKWIQRMDVATTAALWVACKEQARMDGMKAGTEEFWRHTTELYERVLRETQPMYDGLHRTAHQKQQGTIMQYLFPFRTVPIQNHGQIAAAYETLKASRNKSKAEQKAAQTFFAKTVWAQTESAFIFALMTFVAAALKRKTKKYRDEDEEFTAESFLRGFGTDMASTLFSVGFPVFGSELWNAGSSAYGKLTGSSAYTYDVFSVGVVDMLNDLVTAGGKVLTDTGKILRGEMQNWSDFGDHCLAMLLKGAKLAGIPADTVKTYFQGMMGNAKDIMQGRVPAINDESWERANSVNASRYFKAWQAGDSAKQEIVLNELSANVDGDEDKVRNTVNNVFKDAYEGGEISLDEYTRFIQNSGLFDDEKQKNKVRDLARDALTAGEMSEEDAIRYLTGTGLYDEDEAWKKTREWADKAEHAEDEDYAFSQYGDLRDAFISGQGIEEAVQELKDHGFSDSQLSTEISADVRDGLLEGRISEDEAIGYLVKLLGKDENAAWKTVQKWQASAEHADEEDYSYSQYDAIDAAIDANGDIKALTAELTAHGVEEKNIASHVKSYLVESYESGQMTETQFKNKLSRYCGIVGETADKLLRNANVKKATGYSWDELDNAYRDGNVTASAAKKMLTAYGGMSAGDAEARVRYWDFQKAYPDANMKQETVDKYYDSDGLRASGLTLDNYVKYYTQASKAQGTDLNHDGRTDSGSKKAAVMKIIDSLPISRSQKDALYYFNGWSAKTIYEAPWH